MVDPTAEVERVAQALAKNLNEDWENMPEWRKASMRKTAFFVFENVLNARKRTMQGSIELVEDLLSDPATPKNCMRGIKEASRELRARLALEQDMVIVGATIPDHLPTDFDAPDPLEALEPGDVNPLPLLPYEERCNAVHDDGWECTRAPHPPHWRHMDADPDVVMELKGQVHATWMNEDDIVDVSDAYIAYVEGHEL